MKLLLALLVLVLLAVPTSGARWLSRLLVVRRAAALWNRRRRSRRRDPVCKDVLSVVPKHEWKCTPAKKKHVWKNVTKWHKTKNNVTKWTNATRNVTRSESVEYTLPVEDFIGLAKEHISEDLLASFEAGVASDQNRNFGATCTDTSEPVAHVGWGPSQAAKSTLICQLRKSPEDLCPEIGDGSGESVTTTVSVWDSIVGIMVDTIGLGDSLLRYSKEEIGKLVAAAMGRIAAVDVKRVKFLVFESLANDALQLRDTLLNLFKIFGEEVRSSIIVIATKPNMKPGEAGVKRLRKIQEVMSQQGLRELVIWNGPERDETSVDDLMAAVGRVSSVPISELDDFWERVMRKAQDLCEHQSPRTKNITIHVLEEYLVPETVEEEVEVNYTEPEKFLEQYEGENCIYHEITETIKVTACT